ncbi:MAG: hypothetical protein AMXMBFR64_60380 [Myxococcales bacterium]
MSRGSKAIKAAARSLRSRPGWDPQRRASETDEQRLASAMQAHRNEGVYESAGACAACGELRAETGDATALCDEHLAAAL